MELSNRLQAVADLLDCHEAIADIGCDHGFVSIYLIESKKASKVLAMDVNKGPLERAKEHVEEKRLSTYIETRLSDGAKALEFLTNEDGASKLEVQAALTSTFCQFHYSSVIDVTATVENYVFNTCCNCFFSNQLTYCTSCFLVAAVVSF